MVTLDSCFCGSGELDTLVSGVVLRRADQTWQPVVYLFAEAEFPPCFRGSHPHFCPLILIFDCCMISSVAVRCPESAMANNDVFRMTWVRLLFVSTFWHSVSSL